MTLLLRARGRRDADAESSSSGGGGACEGKMMASGERTWNVMMKKTAVVSYAD
jgi:hypothetical protein